MQNKPIETEVREFVEHLGAEIIFCQNCQEPRNILENHCAACKEMICRICGCTDSEPCIETCFWIEPGHCDNCLNSEAGANYLI